MSPERARTLADVPTGGRWVPIPGCSGRDVLRGRPDLLLHDWIPEGTPLETYTPTTGDPIRVARLPDGSGWLAFQKPDGRHVITRNSAEALTRRLTKAGYERRTAGGHGDPESRAG